MNSWTDEETGARITGSRERRITETVHLKFDDEFGELYLSYLRAFVERTAHIPGTAVVQQCTDGLLVTYYVIEDEESVS